MCLIVPCLDPLFVTNPIASQLLLDGGLFADYLKKVKTWLDSNPNEVISILIVNIENQPASSFAAVYEAANMVDISYAPATTSVTADQWPTLGTLIDTGKRVLTFMDNSADATAAPYIIDGELGIRILVSSGRLMVRMQSSQIFGRPHTM